MSKSGYSLLLFFSDGVLLQPLYKDIWHDIICNALVTSLYLAVEITVMKLVCG